MQRIICSLLFFAASAGLVCGTEISKVRARVLAPPPGAKAGFSLVPPEVSAVRFTNELTGDAFLTNAVAHNGSGVAIGDVDGNGWADLYFCNLLGANRLYLNQGSFRFIEAAIGAAGCAEQLSTGAALADLDGDGDLDLLVNGIAAGTRLFLNDGRGEFVEKIGAGLARDKSATSMALADVDGDGDLDLYCAHYIDVMHLADSTTKFALGKRGTDFFVAAVNGVSTATPRFKDRFQILPGGRLRELPERDALYINVGEGRFVSVEDRIGVFLNEEGKPIPPFRDWGLAVMFRDVNGDSAPDLYVCNDNASSSRFWLNTGRGTFRLQDNLTLRHGSRSAMGVDFADVDRDGHDDFVVLDMFARDPARRMTQLVKDYPAAAERYDPGAHSRFNRNSFFFGNADGFYREAALFAGLAASDWSWCPIFMDVDLDGFEDLLVSNGFAFDVMDKDSHDGMRGRKLTEFERKRSRQFHPSWPSVLAAFRNLRDGTFAPAAEEWGFREAGIGHGMAAGDLDNDGDLDLVVNRLNAPASLYRNDATGGRVAVRLKGAAQNTRGIGARIRLLGGEVEQAQEMIAGGRYMSGDDAMRVFAADPDSSAALGLEVTWRSGLRTVVTNVQPNRVYEISEEHAEPPPPPVEHTAPFFADASALLDHTHEENPFDDWAAQPTLPRALSREGPALAWFDANGDGWDDLVVGAARGKSPALFENREGTTFVPKTMREARGELGAIVEWISGAGARRLLAAKSNFETPKEPSTIVSLSGNEADWTLAFGETALGPLAVADIDRDGDLDLFAGGRVRPGRYPEGVSSAVWSNEQGQLTRHSKWSDAFESVGMVTSAAFADFNGDRRIDLALAMEWGPVKLFVNAGDHFEEATESWGLADSPGLWTSVAAGDFDGDGRLDLAAGNRGRNSEYELGQPGPWRVFHGDWNRDGKTDSIEAWANGDAWFPLRSRPWLEGALPELSVKFPKHQDFGTASVEEILGSAFTETRWVEAGVLESSVFLNRGDRFERRNLPREAQLTPATSVAVADFDGDGKEDLFLSQNFFGTSSELTRNDAGFGLWLQGLGDGNFRVLKSNVSGIRIPGEQRAAALADFDRDGRVDLAVGQNNGPTKLYRNVRAKPGVRVILQGPEENPDAIGAGVRLLYEGGSAGPVRSISSGSGHYSQNSRVALLGFERQPTSLWVRWPNGSEQIVPFQGAGEQRIIFKGDAK